MQNLITAPAFVINKLMINNKVDFNLVIPMPPEINENEAIYKDDHQAAKEIVQLVENGTAFSVALSQVQSRFAGIEKERVFQYLDLCKKYGYFNWVDWIPAHWGVKYNADETRIINQNQIRFCTTNSSDNVESPPHLVIEKLAIQTKAEILHEWISDFIEENTGWRKYSNGILQEERNLSNADEQNKLKSKLRKICLI